MATLKHLPSHIVPNQDLRNWLFMKGDCYFSNSPNIEQQKYCMLTSDSLMPYKDVNFPFSLQTHAWLLEETNAGGQKSNIGGVQLFEKPMVVWVSWLYVQPPNQNYYKWTNQRLIWWCLQLSLSPLYLTTSIQYGTTTLRISCISPNNILEETNSFKRILEIIFNSDCMHTLNKFTANQVYIRAFAKPTSLIACYSRSWYSEQERSLHPESGDENDCATQWDKTSDWKFSVAYNEKCESNENHQRALKERRKKVMLKI